MDSIWLTMVMSFEAFDQSDLFQQSLSYTMLKFCITSAPGNSTKCLFQVTQWSILIIIYDSRVVL